MYSNNNKKQQQLGYNNTKGGHVYANIALCPIDFLHFAREDKLHFSSDSCPVKMYRNILRLVEMWWNFDGANIAESWILTVEM